jgi:hypothetical protein
MTTTSKKLNTRLRIAIVLVSSLSCLSMASISHYELLNSDDQEKEAVDQKGTPALSSGLNAVPQWESFNTWQCFPTENIRLECTELDNGEIRVPTLRFSKKSIMYDFSLDPEPGLDCDQILEKWATLLENQRSFCVYAAHLQKYPDNPFQSEGIAEWHLWIVNQIKTNNGYWKWAHTEKEPAAENNQVVPEAED